MATVEERLAYLEGRVTDGGVRFSEIRGEIAAVGGRITVLDAAMNERFQAVDHRLTTFEERVDRRFEAVEQRLDALDQKFDRRFVWLIGTQVMTLASVLGAFSAAVVAFFD